VHEAMAPRSRVHPHRLLLDLQPPEAGAASAERPWIKVKVFREPIEYRGIF